MLNPYVTITRKPHPSSKKPTTVPVIDNYYRTNAPLDMEMAWNETKWTPEGTSIQAGIDIRYVPEETNTGFGGDNPTMLETTGATIQDVVAAINS